MLQVMDGVEDCLDGSDESVEFQGGLRSVYLNTNLTTLFSVVRLKAEVCLSVKWAFAGHQCCQFDSDSDWYIYHQE